MEFKKALACYGEGVCFYFSGFSAFFFFGAILWPASVSCSPCRSILLCSQVRRVTNIYVLSFCVSSSLSVVIIRPISSMESELPVFLNSLTIIDSINTGQLYVLLDDEKVAACVIANDEKVDGYSDAPWQIDSDE